jgi:hypothetical protein
MIAKQDLTHGAYYRGRCRNAEIARWDGPSARFYYLRHKFGETFTEEIFHPEDTIGFDTFEPKAETPAPDNEIRLPKTA